MGQALGAKGVPSPKAFADNCLAMHPNEVKLSARAPVQDPEHYEWVCRQLRKHELRQKRLKAQLHYERQSRAAEHETMQRILEGQVNLQEIESRLRKLRSRNFELVKRECPLHENLDLNEVDTCSESDDQLTETEQQAQDSSCFEKDDGSVAGSIANDSMYATSNASEVGDVTS